MLCRCRVDGLRSVEEAEEPERNLVAKADLEEILAVNSKIAFRRIDDGPSGAAQLIQEKRLADSPDLDLRRKRVHEIRIVAIDLVRTRQVPEIKGLRRQQGEKPRPLKRIQHLQTLVPVRLQFGVELVHLRHLRTGRRQDHQHLLRLLDRRQRNVLRLRPVPFQRLRDNLRNAVQIPAARRLVEGIVPVGQITLELRHNRELGRYATGDAPMIGKYLLQGTRREAAQSLEIEILAERQPLQLVTALPARQVPALAVQLHQRRSAVDDAELRVIVVDVLDQGLPRLEVMHFVDIQTRSAIRSGNFSSTKAGEYMLSIREQFPPEVFFDMVCYVQLFLEIRIDKQSDMLLRQAGFTDENAEKKHKERSLKKAELASLAAQIGRTGMRVLAPLVRDDI